MKITITDFKREDKKIYLCRLNMGRWEYSWNDSSLNKLFKWAQDKIKNE